MLFPYNKKVEVLNVENALGYLLASTGCNDIVELHIGEKGCVAAHVLPIDVTFYVIEGSGSITIGADTHTANKGDVIHVPKGEERGWQNNTAQSLKLLVIKQV